MYNDMALWTSVVDEHAIIGGGAFFLEENEDASWISRVFNMKKKIVFENMELVFGTHVSKLRVGEMPASL